MIFIGLMCVACLAMYVVGVFNIIERLRDEGMNRFFQVDVQLKNRQNLISELLNTVRDHNRMEHEIVSKLQSTINYANNVQSSTQHCPYSYKSMGACISAQVDLMENLQDFYIVLESFPEIVVSKEVIELKCQIDDSTSRSEDSMKSYNLAVEQYNTQLQTSPTNLLAKLIGLSRMISEQTINKNVRIDIDENSESTNNIVSIAPKNTNFQTS